MLGGNSVLQVSSDDLQISANIEMITLLDDYVVFENVCKHKILSEIKVRIQQKPTNLFRISFGIGLKLEKLNKHSSN